MSITLDGTNGIVTPDIDSGVSTLGPLTQELNLGSTGQVVFPATQNASSNANTLDDYEEGTFTPVLTGSTSGTFNGAGRYTKIGQIVHISMAFREISTVNRPIGDYSITGMPFASIAAESATQRVDAFGGIFHFPARVTFDASKSIDASISGTSTSVVLSEAVSNGLSTPVTEANFVNGATMFFRVSITYPTST